MPVSEAQKRATAKYEKENYDKVLVRFPKGTKDRINATGADSVNSYIINWVLNALDCSQDANTATKTAEPEKIPETPKKPERTPVDLAELQRLFDEKKAEIDREKRIENGEFMTVSKEEEERYRGKKES